MPPRPQEPTLRRLPRLLLATTVIAPLLATAHAAPASAAITAPSVQWTVNPGGTIRQSSVLLTDLEGDGSSEVLVGAHDGKLYAYQGSNGATEPGWPKQLSHGIDSSPSAADTDGDGKKEVFVGAGRSSDGAGGLYSFDHDGGQRFDLPAGDRVFGDPAVFSTPAIGDTNRDGVADLAFGTLGLESIWSTTHTGVKNWQFYSDDTVFSSAALADVNGDGQTDVVIGSDSTPGAPVDHAGGIVRAFNGTNGSVIWEFRTDEIVKSSPSIGDIDGDGSLEVVFGTGDCYIMNPDCNEGPGGANRTPADAHFLFAVNAENGIQQWKRDLGGVAEASPTLADLNGDGILDVAVGTNSTGVRAYGTAGANHGYVFGLNGGNGGNLAGFGSPKSKSTHSRVLGQIVTADFDGDGGQDLLVPGSAALIAYSGKTGAELFEINTGQVTYQSSPAIGDVDGDNKLDIVAAGTAGSNQVRRWEFANTTARLGNKGWHQFRKDERRTGSWTNPPLTQSLCDVAPGKGYRFVASDGGVFSYCKPFHGSAGGVRLAAPIIDMASPKGSSGYYLLGADGGVFTYGGVPFYGSTGGIRLAAPIVGMATDPDGDGYWFVASDGGIFAYNAPFHGSLGGQRLNAPIIGMAASPSGGYYLIGADGGVFAFGAPFYGSTGGMRLNSPIVGMAADPDGHGYWFVAADGGIFAYEAGFSGSLGGVKLNAPVVGMAPDTDGGYYLLGRDGGVFAFDAPFVGSTGGIKLNQPIVAMDVPLP